MSCRKSIFKQFLNLALPGCATDRLSHCEGVFYLRKRQTIIVRISKYSSSNRLMLEWLCLVVRQPIKRDLFLCRSIPSFFLEWRVRKMEK